jgi:hypothetical protein
MIARKLVLSLVLCLMTMTGGVGAHPGHDTAAAPVMEVTEQTWVQEVLDSQLPVFVESYLTGPLFEDQAKVVAAVAPRYQGKVKFVRMDRKKYPHLFNIYVGQLPPWLADKPIAVIYPVRGLSHHADGAMEQLWCRSMETFNRTVTFGVHNEHTLMKLINQELHKVSTSSALPEPVPFTPGTMVDFSTEARRAALSTPDSSWGSSLLGTTLSLLLSLWLSTIVQFNRSDRGKLVIAFILTVLGFKVVTWVAAILTVVVLLLTLVQAPLAAVIAPIITFALTCWLGGTLVLFFMSKLMPNTVQVASFYNALLAALMILILRLLLATCLGI